MCPLLTSPAIISHDSAHILCVTARLTISQFFGSTILSPSLTGMSLHKLISGQETLSPEKKAFFHLDKPNFPAGLCFRSNFLWKGFFQTSNTRGSTLVLFP